MKNQNKKLAGYKVLIAEDDNDLREILAEDFKAEGATVEEAKSGEEAIEMIRKSPYDMVLSDMRMPNGDGRFLAKNVMQITGPKPLVFLYSGYSNIDRAECDALQIKAVFTKPFSMNDLVDGLLGFFKKTA